MLFFLLVVMLIICVSPSRYDVPNIIAPKETNNTPITQRTRQNLQALDTFGTALESMIMHSPSVFVEPPAQTCAANADTCASSAEVACGAFYIPMVKDGRIAETKRIK